MVKLFRSSQRFILKIKNKCHAQTQFFVETVFVFLFLQNCSIRIEGLSEKTTTEALRNYFENTRRSNGGDVEDATILGETALVRFVDHEGNLPNFHLGIRNSILVIMWCTNVNFSSLC